MKFVHLKPLSAHRHLFASITLLAATGYLLIGCSTTRYHEAADRDVYEILEAKSAAVPGMTNLVNIDPVETRSLDNFPKATESLDFLGADADSEIGSSVITLEDALEIAFTQSRDYQARKESLYLSALALTLERHQFAPFFGASVSPELAWASSEAQKDAIRNALDEMTGAPGAMIEQYAEILEDSGTLTRDGGIGPRAGASADAVFVDSTTSIEARSSFGLNMLFMGGTQLALDVTSNFVEFLGGAGLDSAFSSVTAVLTRPLLRGAGRDVVAEALTQAERDVLYELRDFTRFRKEWAVRTASNYYSVLRSRDDARNTFSGLKGKELSLARERARQAVGQQTAAQVGILESSMLGEDLAWTSSIVRYKRELDNFKIFLGFPVDSAIVLDDNELAVLAESRITLPDISTEDAVELALIARLDLYTDHDLVFDAQRRINVAANSLKADLDLVLTGSVDSKDGNRFASFDLGDGLATAGFDLDLPLDRKAERNTYRRALIAYEVAKRSADLATDTVKLEVRDDWRALEVATKEFEISQKQVEINRNRVEEENLLLELGRGDIRDQVAAQDEFTRAKTGLTNALVTHTIAQLQLWRDIGILYIKNNGQWEEVADAS